MCSAQAGSRCFPWVSRVSRVLEPVSARGLHWMCGVWLPARGGAGDGVHGGSPAGLCISPTRGSLERAEGEERWRCLHCTRLLRSQPGTVEVSHRHSQRRHFAQAGENVLWSSPCVLHCDPLSLCWDTHQQELCCST